LVSSRRSNGERPNGRADATHGPVAADAHAVDGLDVFAGGGELAARMRAFDWSRTPLGPVADWPQSLKTCVRVLLTARQPMFVWWGDALVHLYNDAYRSVLRAKHPDALGRPAPEVWPEIWDELGPRAVAAMARNEGACDEALRLLVRRNGYVEEAFFTFSYSPVPSERGDAGGVLCTVTDDTPRIVGERQLALLRELLARAPHAGSEDEASAQIARAFKAGARDLPFALVYRADADGRHLSLVSASGIAPGHPAAPERFATGAGGSWPFAEVLAAGEPRVVWLDRSPGDLPRSEWAAPASSAVVWPMPAPGGEGRALVLVAGLNPLRLFDDGYRAFVGMVAAQVASSLAAAGAREQEARRRAALAEIEGAKAAFFDHVGDALLTPLTMVLAPIEDLRAAAPPDGEERERVERLHRSAQRLSKSVQALLAAARGDGGDAAGAFDPATDSTLAALTRMPTNGVEACVDDALRSVPPRRESLPGGGALSLGTRERIVVADDDEEMRELLARLLGERWSVEVASSGEEALAAIRREPADLVVADVMMRGLGGLGLLRAIRGDPTARATAVVLLSARAGEESAAQGLDLGADDCIVKPFAARELLVRVAGRLAATKAARETNEHRRALYRLFMQAPFPITVVRGPDHIIELANDRMRELLCWSEPTASVGKPLAAAVPQVLENGVLRLLDEVYRTGIMHSAVSDPRPMPTGPGGATECHYHNRVFAPLFDPNGVIEGVIASSFDVTEQVTARQKVEKARAEAEALAAQLMVASRRLEAAQRVGGIGIFDWELREERVYWSPEVFALMGLAPGAIEPSVIAWTHAMVLEDREPGWAAFHRASAAHDERFEVEVRLRQPDGAARWIRISALILYDAAGDPVRSLGAIVDIETLKTGARELERANRAKDEFLATMSHELRTPLNAVLGWATILTKTPRDAAQVERGLAVIARNARTQVRLVSDLLDVSRIISGKLQLTLRRTELASVVRAAADVVGPAADAKGVRLVVDLDPELGAIVGDADRLQQVLWNLLTNAVRFTARGGRVAVTGDRVESGVRVRVQDTGAGIPREHLQHIFERFRQVDSSTTRTYGGLGLGLAIVRHLVEAHGGSVEAHSEGSGRGSTFTLHLPIAAVDPSRVEPEVAPPVAEPPPAPVAGLREVRVLVVDDDEDSLELLRFVLTGAGARVTTARSAREALEAQGPFDVIVSDIAMPEMDGYSFIRRLRSRDTGADVPAIALSAYARSEDADRAMRAGYQEHLRKPVDPSTLLDAVRAWALVQCAADAPGLASHR
jgi:signal transduction histidine kinase